MEDAGKYARVERERRWLVTAGEAARMAAATKPHKKAIVDRYLACGRLRLRAQTEVETGRRVLKLTKKHASPSPRATPLVTILLSEEEHAELARLPGFPLVKTRAYFDHAGLTYALDVFDGPLAGLVTCELEAGSDAELAAAPSPPCAAREITDDPFFTGASLARLDAAALAPRLAAPRLLSDRTT